MDFRTVLVVVFAFVGAAIGSIIGVTVAEAQAYGWKDTIRTLIAILKDPFGT